MTRDAEGGVTPVKGGFGKEKCEVPRDLAGPIACLALAHGMRRTVADHAPASGGKAISGKVMVGRVQLASRFPRRGGGRAVVELCRRRAIEVSER